MIQDLDETLRALLVQSVPLDPNAVDISFALPNREWADALSKPAINLFLYDVRENHELRSNERFVTRNGNVGTEARAPLRLDLTYLVSVWAAEVDDEHKLLGEVLRALLSHPAIPESALQGAMATQPYPLHVWIAQPDRSPNAWDFWGGIDGRLKPGIHYVVTLALPTAAATDVRLVTERVIELQQK